MRAIGFLCCYYPKYSGRAIAETRNVLKAICDDFRLVIVDNSGCLSNYVAASNEKVVLGSNAGWEFSAWDEGVAAGEYDASDILIFLNDTFCHHRPYTFVDRMLFVRAIRKLRGSPLFVGEVNAIQGKIGINEMEFPAWVSSYFFAMKGITKTNLGKLDYIGENSLHKEAKYSLSDNGGQFQLSPRLRAHIQNWLFPSDKPGWHGVSRPDGVKELKLMAILNEKMLSCRLYKGGVVFEGVYSGRVASIYFKLMNKLFRTLY